MVFFMDLEKDILKYKYWIERFWPESTYIGIIIIKQQENVLSKQKHFDKFFKYIDNRRNGKTHYLTQLWRKWLCTINKSNYIQTMRQNSQFTEFIYINISIKRFYDTNVIFKEFKFI